VKRAVILTFFWALGLICWLVSWFGLMEWPWLFEISWVFWPLVSVLAVLVGLALVLSIGAGRVLTLRAHKLRDPKRRRQMQLALLLIALMPLLLWTVAGGMLTRLTDSVASGGQEAEALARMTERLYAEGTLPEDAEKLARGYYVRTGVAVPVRQDDGTSPLFSPSKADRAERLQWRMRQAEYADMFGQIRLRATLSLELACAYSGILFIVLLLGQFILGLILWRAARKHRGAPGGDSR
jgi:hypothetical protein